MSSMFVCHTFLIGLYFLFLLFSLKISCIALYSSWRIFKEKGFWIALQQIVMNIFVIAFSFFIIMILPNMIIIFCHLLGLPSDWLQPFAWSLYK